MNVRTASRHSSPTRARRWKYRSAAILLALVPFLAAEAVLRVGGWGAPREWDDPYVAFAGSRTLFELNADRSVYEIPPERQSFFRPESFAATKSPHGFRIFCLGGSTVQGRPFAVETAFTTWLEILLRTHQPERDWEVVNCGGVSYASYRLAPILDEVLGYDPDLIVLYTGHNEFLEDRTYAPWLAQPDWKRRAVTVSSRSHLVNICRRFVRSGREARERPILPVEVEARLDYRGGLEAYRRDDVWRDGVVSHFSSNVERMIRRCRDAGVPLILVNPVENLKDAPPFKFERRADMSPEEVDRFERLWSAAQADDLTPDQRSARLREALELDPRHAAVLFHLGKCREAARDFEEADALFREAKDEDICPLRCLEAMHEDLERLAARYRLPWVDVRSQFADRSEGGIPGRRWLIDHVHPTIEGHQLVARWIWSEMVAQGWAERSSDAETRVERAFARHLSGLDAVYFSEGERRLEGLRRWSQGRAFEVRGPDDGG